MSPTLSAAEIQNSLKEPVALTSIQNSLKLLVNHQLLELVAPGKYRRCSDEFITTTNDVAMSSTHPYYSQIISKAQSAIEMSVDEREFQFFSIGMKKENLSKAKEVMRKARAEIALFSDKQGDHVYQFNFNGFPLAEIRQELN
jgi:uncharacterized protein (TIGR02147 family)